MALNVFMFKKWALALRWKPLRAFLVIATAVATIGLAPAILFGTWVAFSVILTKPSSILELGVSGWIFLAGPAGMIAIAGAWARLLLPVTFLYGSLLLQWGVFMARCSSEFGWHVSVWGYSR